MIKLIVGLGNPGKQYEQTRHNAGFLFLDRLAEQYGAQFSMQSKFLGELAKVRVEASDVWLLKPATYMNRSGQSVGAVMRYYDLKPDQVLVAHDELDLDPGVVRLKLGGGHGGHNGLRSVSEHIGTDYARLRIGIGHPGDRAQVTNYVLGAMSAQNTLDLDRAVSQSLDCMSLILKDKVQQAMQQLHTA